MDDKHENERMETQAWKQQQSQVVSFRQGRALGRQLCFQKVKFFTSVNFYNTKAI